MGKTSAKSKNKWNAKSYDRITLIVYKGKKKKIKACAESCGESMNAFVNRLIDEEMKKREV